MSREEILLTIYRCAICALAVQIAFVVEPPLERAAERLWRRVRGWWNAQHSS